MAPHERTTAPVDGGGLRFELAVWPLTTDEPWHAEVRAPGEVLPHRFERPVDLVLYLTQLSDPPHQRRGLR